MGDSGDLWRAQKEHYRKLDEERFDKVRKQRRKHEANGVRIREHTPLHWRVIVDRVSVNFWPTTGVYRTNSGDISGRVADLDDLVRRLEAIVTARGRARGAHD